MHKTSTFMKFKRGYDKLFDLKFIFRLILKLKFVTYRFLWKTVTIVPRLDLYFLLSNATQNSQSEQMSAYKIFRGALKIVHKIFISKLSNIFLPF